MSNPRREREATLCGEPAGRFGDIIVPRTRSGRGGTGDSAISGDAIRPAGAVLLGAAPA